MNKKGKNIINKIKQKSKLPIIIKVKQFYQKKNIDNQLIIARRILDYDILSTNLYVLAYNIKQKKIGGQDFTNKMIILDY